MAKRDPQRTERLRVAVRYLLAHNGLTMGSQTRLAEHFKVSRQRVHQIVVEERRQALLNEGAASTPATAVAS